MNTHMNLMLVFAALLLTVILLQYVIYYVLLHVQENVMLSHDCVVPAATTISRVHTYT